MVDAGTVPGGAPLTMPVDAGYNVVDVTQLVLLLDRHDQREELTTLMVARSSDPETRELARRAAADATEADAAAAELLEEWGQSDVRSTPTAPRLAGADAASVLAELQALGGDDFDRAALGVLLQELQRDVVDGAIARNDGRADDARRLGDETVSRAQQRIEKARSLLDRSG
jgi:uncharacterized protein (DUF305 family)